jgi:hypothetical protein
LDLSSFFLVKKKCLVHIPYDAQHTAFLSTCVKITATAHSKQQPLHVKSSVLHVALSFSNRRTTFTTFTIYSHGHSLTCPLTHTHEPIHTHARAQRSAQRCAQRSAQDLPPSLPRHTHTHTHSHTCTHTCTHHFIHTSPLLQSSLTAQAPALRKPPCCASPLPAQALPSPCPFLPSHFALRAA